MANIYSEQGITDVYTPITTSENNLTQTTLKPFQKLLDENARKKEQEAKKLDRKAERSMQLYESGMQNITNSSMRQIYEANKDNPMQLAEELDKLNSDVIEPIQDEETKIRVRTNFLLNRDTYINSAQKNMEELQKRLEKQREQESLYNSFDLISTSVGDMLSDDTDGSGYTSYMIARDNINKIITSKDSHGLYKFTPYQQRKLKEDLKKINVDGVKTYFNNLSENDKIYFADNFSSNSRYNFLDDEEKSQVNDFMKKYKTKIKENGYEEDPEEASAKAISNLVALDELDNAKSVLFEKKKGEPLKINKKTSIYDLLEYRDKIKDYKINDVISDKEYSKYIAETVNPLLDKVQSYDPEEGLPDKYLGKVYRSVMLKIDPNGTFTNERKAYILNQAYDLLKSKEINPEENPIFANKEQIVEISNRITQDYIEDQDPSILGKKIDNVVLGNVMVNYSEGRGLRNIKTAKSEIRKSPDGRLFRIYRDKDNRVINKILIRG